MRHGLLLGALLLCSAARAQSTATLRGIDVYRSSKLTSAEASERFGGRLKQYVMLRNYHQAAADEKAEILRKAVEAEAAKLPGLARVELTMAEYFTSVDHAMYATFDVVDESDQSRLAFTPAPKQVVADPGGMIAAWKAYYDLGAALSKRGQMPVDRPDCPGFYCLWSTTAPELAAVQDKLVAGAKEKAADLRKVLDREADGEKRAAALFALSYASDGGKLLEACYAALKDPSASVRGAGLQILADIANHHTELPVDMDRILPLLDDPSGGVRGKAMGLLVPMTDTPARRKKMIAAGPRLIELLKLQQPDNRDLAFTLLGEISRKSYDRRDFTNWEAWAARAAAGKEKE